MYEENYFKNPVPDEIQWSAEHSGAFEIEGSVKSYIFGGSFHKVLVKLINGDEIKITRLTDVKLPEGGYGDLSLLASCRRSCDACVQRQCRQLFRK